MSIGQFADLGPQAYRRSLAVLLALAAWTAPVMTQCPAIASSTPFVANEGQWPTAARFVARTGGEQVRADPGAVVWQRWAIGPDGRQQGWMVRLEFEGARREAVIRGDDRLAGDSHFLLGSDRTDWRRHVPRFESVVYEGLYDGVNLRLRSSTAGLDLQLQLEPGARVEDVVVRCGGVAELGLDPDDRLLLKMPVGTIKERSRVRQSSLSAAADRLALCRFRLVGADRFGFQSDRSAPEGRFVIEAGLEWATYLGGDKAEGDSGKLAVGFGPGSQVTIAGNTLSPSFPTTPGAYDAEFSVWDVFVTRLSEGGSEIVFSTFVGGELGETPEAMIVDSAGSALIAGRTNSKTYPTTVGAFDTTKNGPLGSADGFVTRITPDGSGLVFSTFLGGTGFTDEIEAMAVSQEGDIVVTGVTNSIDFPITARAFDPTHAGTGLNDFDAFISRLDGSGSRLEFSTYLGGSATEFQLSVALLADGSPVVGGITKSRDFPLTAGAFNASPNDMFVAVLSADGTQLQAATSLGGSHNQEALSAVAVSPLGEIVVAGVTQSSDFPTTPDAFQTSDPGGLGINGFVSIFDPTLSKLEHSTYLWGGASVGLNTLLVDPLGAPIVGGMSSGAFFPTTPGAFKEVLPFGDINDVFVTRFSPDLRELWYSTYVGGSGWEDVGPGNPGLALDVDGAVVATFASTSTDFPTGPDAFQPSFAGATDAIVARLSLLPMGVSKYGASTPGAQGPLAAGVTAMPSVGTVEFALTCGHAPPLSNRGWLIVGLHGLPAPVAVAGASLWVDPTTPLWLLPVRSDEIGACVVPLRLPEDPAAAGLQAFMQFLWKDPDAPTGPLSASNALAITIQP